MSARNVIQFRKKLKRYEFEKIVDGETIIVTNVDAMSPEERAVYFAAGEAKSSVVTGAK